MNTILKANETMEDFVRKLTESFDAVSGVAPIAYWYENLTEQGRIKDIHFSDQMRRMLGYGTKDEFPDALDTLKNFLHPDDVPVMMERAIGAGTGRIDGYDVQYRIRRADGEYMWCKATGQVVKDPDGRTVGVYGAFIDISSEMKLQRELEVERTNREIAKSGDDRVLQRLVTEKLMDEFDALYVVDLAENEIRPVRSSRVSQVGAFTEAMPYDAVVRKFTETVDPKYRGDWENFADHDFVRRYMAEVDHREYVYELPGLKKSVRRFCVDVLEREAGVAKSLLFSFSGIDEEQARSILLEREMSEAARHEKLKAALLAFSLANDDIERFVDFFSSRVLELYGCDQVIYRDVEGRMILKDKPGTPSLDFSLCKDCPHFAFDAPVYRDGFTAMDDCSKGWKGVPVHQDCPVGASLTYLVYEDERVFGYVALHYLEKTHRFTENEKATFDTLAKFVSMVLSRHKHQLAARKAQEANVLKSFGDLINAAAWGMDFNEKFELLAVHWSDELRHMFGFEDETDFPNVLESWADRIHPEDRDRVMEYYWKGVRNEGGEGLVYDITYRIRRKDGEYRWYREVGRSERTPEGMHKVYGLSIDVTAEKALELDRHYDKLLHETIGASRWTYEISPSGKVTSAKYDDRIVSCLGKDAEAMKWLQCVLPEDRSRVEAEFMAAVRDREGKTPYETSFRIALDGVVRWAKSSGRIVRREDGSRTLAGLSIDITDTVEDQQRRALDEAETKRLKEREQELMHAEFRASAVAYLTEHEGDVKSFLGFFAERLRKLIKCDQVIYRGANGEEVVSNSPALGMDFKLDQSRCRMCPYFDMNSPVYESGVSEVPDFGACEGDGRASEGCPVKSSLVRIINLDGNRSGYLAIHYILEKHGFTDSERRTLEEFANLLSLSLDRFEARERNEELQRELRLKQKIEEQQKQLEVALSMAQAANRAKTMFLNNMSHDIRTPMNAIIGFTGLAARHLDSKALVKDYLGKISQSSDHLLSLINDVLDMARIESGKMNLNERPESLPDIVHGLRNIIQNQASDKQLDFYFDCCDVKDEAIVCDKLRLSQVLLNVLSNAIKYTPAGGMVSLRIAEVGRAACPHAAADGENGANGGVGHTALPGGGALGDRLLSSGGAEVGGDPRAPRARYVFTIKDSGVGMSAEYLKEVFDPFSRAKNTTASGVQGTGLGMAITKNIVDMMGGEIGVKSEVGKGTDVTITFDFAVAEPETDAVGLGDLEGARALVVDDDECSCQSVAQTLVDFGLSAEWCTSGGEAVARARAAYDAGSGYRVFIIDWKMPDMNGVETVRRIRKVIGRDMPIIIHTAYDWSDIEEEALEAGVTAFVAKPLFASELRKVLVEQIGEEGRSKSEKVKSGEGAPQDSTLNSQPSTLNSQPSPLSTPVRHILLVEDNEINREIAVVVLTEQGFDVDTAENGEQAVMKVMETNAPGASFPYDFVLMDIQMPVMNGYEATRRIRAWENAEFGMRNSESGKDNSEFLIPNSELKHLPIVALSANAFAEDVAASLEAGMDAHLSKPIKVKELVNCIAKFGGRAWGNSGHRHSCLCLSETETFGAQALLPVSQ